MQNSSLKKSWTKPGTFSGPKRLKKGSGFLSLHYFFVQVAIAFLFCNSPLARGSQPVGMSTGRTAAKIENPSLFSIGEGLGFSYVRIELFGAT